MAGGAGVCARVKDKQPQPSTQISTGPSTNTERQTVTKTVPDLNSLLPYVRGFALNKEQAKTDLAEFGRTPHPFGSKRQAEIIDWIAARVAQSGVQVAKDTFTAITPNPQVPFGPRASDGATVELSGSNIIGRDVIRSDASCVVALGSHFDTKHLDGLSYVGANDGGSSTVALIQQLAYLRSTPPAGIVCDIVGVFFDGEEAMLPEWTDGETKHPARIKDNTYGSRSLAARLTDCQFQDRSAKCLPASLGGKPLVALVLMDMIGSPQLKITRDALSTPALVRLTAIAARALGVEAIYDSRMLPVEDDHIPFLERGVPAVDLIDFENLDYWHRDGDVPENVSLESIEVAARLALSVALAVARDPLIVD